MTSQLEQLQPIDQYVYDVLEVQEVEDGDSYQLKLVKDIGFRVEVTPTVEIRLHGPTAGADTPEKRKGSPFERAEARRAEVIARAWLTSGRRLQVRTFKPPRDNPVADGGFGRWLGDVWDADTGEHLADYLRSLGLASIWPTRWRDEFDRQPHHIDGGEQAATR